MKYPVGGIVFDYVFLDSSKSVIEDIIKWIEIFGIIIPNEVWNQNYI